MGTVDYIIIVIVALILGCAIAYIVKAKQSGRKCIGCPNSKSCSGDCSCCTSSPK